MIDLKGIEYVLLAGLGACAGLGIVTPFLAIASIWWPNLWPWVLSPGAIGAVIGLVAASLFK